MGKKRQDQNDKSDREEFGGTNWPWDKKKKGPQKSSESGDKNQNEESGKPEKRKQGAESRESSRPANKSRSGDRGSSRPSGKSRPGKRETERPGSKSRPEKRGTGRRSGKPEPFADYSRGESENKSRTYPKRARKSDSSPGTANKASQEPYLKETIRLNKYIAHAGLCSRREADEYIEQGKVKVNGKVVTELGTKIKQTDDVVVEKQKVSLEPFVYLLLNKGKDTISTTDDEKDRNTVIDAVEDATGYRVYPVGRLDRNTMGLLILTNDGDLAHRLMHPSYKVKKTYEVTANRPLTEEEVGKLRDGVELEDGPIVPHQVKRHPMDPAVITISVFEGRNHLIRRMINFIGADVTKLKRVQYAGLTDNDLRVGRWRYLKQKEINDLRTLVKLDTLDFNKEES